MNRRLSAVDRVYKNKFCENEYTHGTPFISIWIVCLVSVSDQMLATQLHTMMMCM